MKPLSLMFAVPPLVFMLTGLTGPVQVQQELDRTVLPILDPVYEPITELDARNAKAPPPFSVKASEGAPFFVPTAMSFKVRPHRHIKHHQLGGS